MKMIWSAFRSAALLLLLIAATGCTEKSSPLVERSELTVKSGDRVRVAAAEGADEYTWRGLEGTDGISFNTKGRILEFTAPAVQKRHTALFEIEAKFRFFTQNQNVKVVIEPARSEKGTNSAQTPGQTDGISDTDTPDANDTAGKEGKSGSTNSTDNDSGDEQADATAGAQNGSGKSPGGEEAGAAPVPSALELTIAETSLNRDHNTTVTLTARYKDNTEKSVTEGITWIITPKDAVKIDGSTLTALEDGNVTVWAKMGNILSNRVKLNIYWEVDGHRLPPEPDPKINNATLLGVDVNHNGVRDDVERWIYKTYEHPIERGIVMQNAYRLQTQISDISKAHEYAKLSNKSLSCEYYLEEHYQWFKDKYEYSDVSKKIKKIQFNNIDRYIAYERYNAQFNGEVFSERIAPNKDNCLFDENGNLKALP